MSSLYTDMAAEARAEKFAALRIGREGRPKAKARQVTDDDGQYLIFSVPCHTCGCELTSRNRYLKTTRCQPCGKAADTERTRLRRQSPGRSGAVVPATPVASKKAASGVEEATLWHPLHQAAIEALKWWLSDPTSGAFRDRLDTAMQTVELNAHILQAQDAELIARLRSVIPPEAPAQG